MKAESGKHKAEITGSLGVQMVTSAISEGFDAYLKAYLIEHPDFQETEAARAFWMFSALHMCHEISKGWDLADCHAAAFKQCAPITLQQKHPEQN